MPRQSRGQPGQPSKLFHPLHHERPSSALLRGAGPPLFQQRQFTRHGTFLYVPRVAIIHACQTAHQLDMVGPSFLQLRHAAFKIQNKFAPLHRASRRNMKLSPRCVAHHPAHGRSRAAPGVRHAPIWLPAARRRSPEKYLNSAAAVSRQYRHRDEGAPTRHE